MEVKDDMLVLSTQGRGFWILDDISPLRYSESMYKDESVVLFDIPSTYLSNLGGYSGPFSPAGKSYQAEWVLWSMDSSKVDVIVTDMKGDTLVTKKGQKVKSGLNKMNWNLRLDPPAMVKDLVMMDMRYPGQGPKVPPGTYNITIKKDDQEVSKTIDVDLDPAWKTPVGDFKSQYDMAREVADMIEESQQRIMHLRKVTEVTNLLKERKSLDSMKSNIDSISMKAKELQDMIYQDKILASQDEINFERKWTNHIIRLYRVVLSQHGKPTAGEQERWTDLQADYQGFNKAYFDFIENQLKPMNQKLMDTGVIHLPEDHEG
ncbi:MAG: hypothetical protein HKN68_18405 [Saprospiraceae bacterium]|nr:hypothetical protein [Saprospiraceae bacterium]